MIKKGFTLAEVLLTLAIVGIVAALTIPALLNSTGNQETISQLKKVNTELNQAFQLIINDNNSSFVDVIAADTNNDLRNKFAEKINFTKTCNQGTAGCYASGLKDLYGSNAGHNFIANGSTAITPNNMNYAFINVSKNCTSGLYTENSVAKSCGEIYVDLNGFKGPNTFGKDIFNFLVTREKIVPQGMEGTNTYTSDWATCNPAQDRGGWGGIACTYRIIKEGWAINY